MYDYKNELKHLSSENADGLHKALLTVSLRAMKLCADAGTVRMDKLMTAAFEAGVSDNWGQLAVIERLTEIGALKEVPISTRVTTQDRLFIWAGV